MFSRITTLLILCTCFLSSVVLGVPQSQRQTSRLSTERSSEIENLLGRARSLPAEFAIDIFLRVEKSKQVDKQWRKEILEEAFTLTAGVQNELREKAIPFPSTPADTRAGFRSLAFALRLDSISLRSRIIDEMLSIDQSVALRMLNEIAPTLPFKTRPCSAQTEYDVSDFYRLLEKIARTVYDAKQIQQGERVQFLLPYVESINSPAQIEPLTNLLISLNLRQKESFIISQAFANAVKNITADDRSFSATLIRPTSTSSVFRLANLYRKTGVPHEPILNNFRSYLVRHLQAARCEDNVKLLEWQLKQLNYAYSDNPFSIDESKPVSVEKSPVVQAYFESSHAQSLLSELKDLRGDDDETREPYTSPSWQEKLLDYLRRLEAWDGSSESDEADYFHQKCMFYKMLLRMAPAGAQSDQVLFSYMKLLGQSRVINESRIEWLWHVNELIRYMNEKPPTERTRLLGIVTNSKNTILQVYGDLAKENY